MAKKAEEIKNETTELTVVNSEALLDLFGDNANMPAILMFDEKKAMKPNELINLASGENVSLSDVLNIELTLEGFGAVKLDYADVDTGEFGTYIRYILVTDRGNFTTTSTFIGRTLKMLYQTMMRSPRIMFKQKETDGKRRFMMEVL